MPDDSLQRLGRRASVIFSTQGLSCIGKSVHHVGEECEECHQQSVHRQQHVALPCTRRREEQVHSHQADRPQEQIEIGMEEGGGRRRPSPLRGRNLPRPLRRRGGSSGDQLACWRIATREALPSFGGVGGGSPFGGQGGGPSGVRLSPRHHRPTPLGNECAKGHAFNLHLKTEHQHQRGHDINDVLRYRHHHWRTSVLHADEPAGHHIKTQHGRCTPYTYIKICAHKGCHFRRRTHQPQRQPPQRHLQYQHASGNHQGKAECPATYSTPKGERNSCAILLCAILLSRHAAGSHPQESHQPVHHVEDHRSYGDSTNHRLVADVTNDGQIDKSQQRYGDICHYWRHCQPQYFPIPLIHFTLQR